jgi:hypothetical protein
MKLTGRISKTHIIRFIFVVNIIFRGIATRQRKAHTADVNLIFED